MKIFSWDLHFVQGDIVARSFIKLKSMLLTISPKNIKGKSTDCNDGCDRIMVGAGAGDAKLFSLKRSYLEPLHRRG